MDRNQQEQIALHRWAVIAEAAGDKLTARERGALARQIAARAHAHPDGSSRTYSRGTIDRWLRAWRKGGLAALKPAERADTGTARAHRSCSPRPLRCGWSCRAARPRRSPRSCITGTGSRSRSGRSAASCAAPGCTARRWPPSRRRTAGMRRRGRTSGGSLTCWSARGCRGRAGTARCGPGCSSSSMIIPGCWPMAGSTAGKTPGPARSCCAGRSPAAACPRFSTRIMPIRPLCRPGAQRPWSLACQGRCYGITGGAGSEVLEEFQERVRGLVAFLPAAGRGCFPDRFLLLTHVGMQVGLSAGEEKWPFQESESCAVGAELGEYVAHSCAQGRSAAREGGADQAGSQFARGAR